MVYYKAEILPRYTQFEHDPVTIPIETVDFNSDRVVQQANSMTTLLPSQSRSCRELFSDTTASFEREKFTNMCVRDSDSNWILRGKIIMASERAMKRGHY
ncbi:unnamed protein product [Didymodactylos carnosus]|uniref:Uncharacterized protein n=1 Tax=Didymodactylos carnosus TaxID=1234261 RepID=A0A815Z3G9_9BILA|nr:unnamed protein product [Didymodactylos carnosus]CAF1577293.1 unnamed protein product [Didymodactylos carnosus]CAF3894532.1 unnamed protein product [Didymodactylos carnosus]CAF4443077.1 unnamed protein product [Didymodactylos carnosus]